MATLNLNRCWINSVPSGAAVSGLSAPGRDALYSKAGEVLTFAGGRRRAIVTDGIAGTVELTLLLLTSAAVETLQSWIGSVVQIRDNVGRKWYGVFWSVRQHEVRGKPGKWHVQITLNVVSQAEGV